MISGLEIDHAPVSFKFHLLMADYFGANESHGLKRLIIIFFWLLHLVHLVDLHQL